MTRDDAIRALEGLGALYDPVDGIAVLPRMRLDRERPAQAVVARVEYHKLRDLLGEFGSFLTAREAIEAYLLQESPESLEGTGEVARLFAEPLRPVMDLDEDGLAQIAACVGDSPCWVAVTGDGASLDAACRDALATLGASWESVDDPDLEPACVAYDVREFSDPRQLWFWRRHYVNEGGSVLAGQDEVLDFAASKPEEYLDETIEDLQECLFDREANCFAMRVTSPKGERAGDYVCWRASSWWDAAAMSLGRDERDIVRIVDCKESGTLLGLSDGSSVEVRVCRSEDVERWGLELPTTVFGVARECSGHVFDEARPPLLAEVAWGWLYDPPTSDKADECPNPPLGSSGPEDPTPPLDEASSFSERDAAER